MSVRAFSILFAAASAFGQPVISPYGIVNNGSYVPYALRNYGIAQGSVFAIFGSKLGPDTLVKAESFPLKTEVGGTSVRVTSFGVAVDAYPLYVTQGQIGALMPSNAPLGTASVTVTYNGQTSAPVETVVVRRSFGAFTANQSGSGPAIAFNYVSAIDQPLNSVLTPARPGQVVTLWGTGLGPVAGDETAGPLPGDLDVRMNVQVAGIPARVLYKGRSGCCAGIDQINIEVPASVQGCYLPVFIQPGQTPSQLAGNMTPTEGTATEQITIAVTANGEPCSDPAGLTGAEISAMEKKGGIRLGWLWLENSRDGAVGTANFANFDSASMLARLGVFGLPSPGTGMMAYMVAGGAGWPAPNPLDAGSLVLTGPGGSFAFTRKASGEYTLETPATLPAGSYTLRNGDGGKDVAAFTATFLVPPPLNWLNPNEVTQYANYQPRWTGGDPNGFVIARSELSNNVAKLLTLDLARADAGSMQFWSGAARNPPRGSVLGVLYTGRFGSENVRFSISPFTPVRFTAPGLDVGLIAAGFFDSRTF